MRIPEPLFPFLNFVVRLLLKSPLHFLMSNDVLLIQYVGRKTGAAYSTPVRYLHSGGRIRCITTEEVQWWRNVQAEPAVSLVVGGTVSSYTAHVLERDPGHIRQLLAEFLAAFPQDAVYQEIRLDPDGSLNNEDLDKASYKAIVVEFQKA